MSQKKTIIYCGSGIVRELKYGPVINISQNLDEVLQLLSNIDKDGWTHSTLSALQYPTAQRTHTITLNTYKRDKELKAGHTNPIQYAIAQAIQHIQVAREKAKQQGRGAANTASTPEPHKQGGVAPQQQPVDNTEQIPF